MQDEHQTHAPVLLQEALEGLCIRSDGWYVDATYGRGGHSREIVGRLGPQGRLLVIDRDPEAIEAARREAGKDDRISIERGSFTMLEQWLGQRGWMGRVHGVLFDLGVSSPQLNDAGRGFSFLRDGPLDMRMDPEQGVSAAQWLDRAGVEQIATVLKDYGEERYARRIARAIVRARTQAPVHTTAQLAEVVAAASPTRERGQHPATRAFQAIRIYINRELEELAAALPLAVQALHAGGRLAVISFHSLEDRIVKRFLRAQSQPEKDFRGQPVSTPPLRLIGRAVKPGEAERARNPRARSAILRVAERQA